MRIINEQELKDILDKHGKWVRGEENGERADLRFANLRSANLSFANLSSADLSSADLSSADLSFADLSFADLSSADLSFADLSFANLRETGTMIFNYEQHVAYYTPDGTLRIGCIYMPVSEWELGFKEIGKDQRYTEEQILMYGLFIKQCVELFKRNTK
jgi:hypothetical protein